MVNISGNICREIQNTHFMLINSHPKIMPFFDKVDRPQMTIWSMSLHAG